MAVLFVIYATGGASIPVIATSSRSATKTTAFAASSTESTGSIESTSSPVPTGALDAFASAPYAFVYVTTAGGAGESTGASRYA